MIAWKKKNPKNSLSSTKFWGTTWMVPMVLSFVCSLGCECVTWSSLRLPAARTHPQHSRAQAAAPGLGAGTLLTHTMLPWWQPCPTLKAVMAPELSGPPCALCSFLLGINIRDDICSSQWGLFIWCQQTLVQAFASSFTSDTGFHLSSINCVNSELCKFYLSH